MAQLREKILSDIIDKSSLKQRVFDNTFSVFGELKDAMLEMASEIDDALDGKLDRRVRIEYRDRGKFEAQLQIASDLLRGNHLSIDAVVLALVEVGGEG